MKRIITPIKDVQMTKLEAYWFTMGAISTKLRQDEGKNFRIPPHIKRKFFSYIKGIDWEALEN